jgi:RNA polymerase sigma factor (sigma-70 family)
VNAISLPPLVYGSAGRNFLVGSGARPDTRLQMPAPRDDHALLRAYVELQDDEAFGEIVARHADLVYAAALRQVGRGGMAEDVTQATFILLARKASSISERIVLAAWLHKATRYSALNAMKMEQRRRIHERRAGEVAAATRQAASDAQHADIVWTHGAALLDEGIAGLGGRDREAVVLRFLQRRSFSDVGRALGVSEEAAQMRVGRALEKLRCFFRGRGLAISASALRASVNANAVVPATATFKLGLAPTVMQAVRSQSISAAHATSIADVAGRAMDQAAARTMALVIGSGVAAAVAIGLLAFLLLQHEPDPPTPTQPRPTETRATASDESPLFASATRIDGLLMRSDSPIWALATPVDRLVVRHETNRRRVMQRATAE